MPSPRSGRSRGRRPFAAYYREWLATYARHHCKPGTVTGYEAAGRLYLIPACCDRDVRSITREDVKRLVYETLLPGRARATVRANLAPLRVTAIPPRRETAAPARPARSAGPPSLWVFASPAGRPPDTDAFRRGPWRQLFVTAGVPYAWPHSLRHSYASLLIQHGESLAYVKVQLGHRSITTTVDVYGHLVAGANRAAVDRLDDA